MKSKDIATIAILVLITGAFTFMLSKSLILSKKATHTKVEVVEPISKDFNFAGKPYFKANSINPTRDITIDVNNNTQPLR